MKSSALEITNSTDETLTESAPTRPNLALIQGYEGRDDELKRLGLFPDSQPQTTVYHDSLPTVIIPTYLSEWILEAKYKCQSDDTIKGKRWAIEKLLAWLAANNATICGTMEIRRYLAYIAKSHEEPGGRWGRGGFGDPERARFLKPVSARTIEYYYNYTKGFFRWCVSQDYMLLDPMRKLTIPRPSKPLIQPFSDEQLEKLFRVAKKGQWPLREEAILRFSLDTGLRAKELVGMSLTNLELRPRAGQIRVLGKGNKERIVPFGQKARTALWSYLGSVPRQGSDRVFVVHKGRYAGKPLTEKGLLEIFWRLGDEAQIRGEVRCSPHTMRHTFAVRALMNGMDVKTVSYMLGHENLRMTMNYLNVANASMVQQHQRFSPGDSLGF